MRLSPIVLVVSLVGCGGKVFVEPTGTIPTVDASAPEVSSVESMLDSSAEDLLVQDTSWEKPTDAVLGDDNASDALTCDNLPKKGKTACCDGKPCLGWCDPGTNQCTCYGLKGGCGLAAVCCSSPYSSCAAESQCLD